MNIPHSSAVRQDFAISMTSMIDVVFLLLIFFVCTASFQVAESILPSPISSSGTMDSALSPDQEVELERVLIEVAQRNHRLKLVVNGQGCASLARLAELLEAVVAIDSTVPVILDIHEETPLGFAIDVYDRCRLAGFEQIHFAASSAL